MTLVGILHLIRQGSFMFSFDLHDGFYALGVASNRFEVSRLFLSASRTIHELVGLTFPIFADLQRPSCATYEMGIMRASRFLASTHETTSGGNAGGAHGYDFTWTTHARHVIGRATRNSRWLHVRYLQSIARQA
jgi:hypothetical protein